MNKKQQQTYLEYLNLDAPKDHKAIALIFNDNGYKLHQIMCSCGCMHSTGGIDSEFVLWDSIIKIDKSS